MKTIVLAAFVYFLLHTVDMFTQTLPTFLEGTWKMENREVYEHWDVLENGSMKGRSYRIENGEEVITEYLEIRKQGDKIVYTATVLNQNEGKGIDFVLDQPDSLTWSFENPEHDFPKVIKYQRRSDSEIYVQVSDGGERGFAYVMHKVNDD